MKHLEFLIWMLAYYPLADFSTWILYQIKGNKYVEEEQGFGAFMSVLLYLSVGYLLY